jgi:hypothetical protein
VSEFNGGWFKSSYSGTGGCLEVRLGTTVLVRDSKDHDGPVLSFTHAEWTAFLRGVVNGQFDLAPEKGLAPGVDAVP